MNARAWLIGFAIGGVALLIAGYLALQWQLARALPDHDVSARVGGLNKPVEILRDGDGVPHIFAENLPDLLFAQGYVHAQDRFFTMDFYRQIARGQLHMLVGSDAEVLENDRFAQTMRFRDLAARDYEALPAREQALLQSFSDGINAYIEMREPAELALEYSALGLAGQSIEITPWTPQDSLAISRLVGFAQSGRDLTREIARASVRAAVGPDMYAQWQPPYDYSRHPTVIGQAEAGLEGVADTGTPDSGAAERTATVAPRLRLAFAKGVERYTLATEGAGSNAWVLAGNRTQSGRAMLAVDPHNGIEIPNIWHEIGLNLRADNGDTVSIYGWAAAPFFLILEGKNDFGAWGTTNVTGGDPLDLFALTINPDNPEQYLWDGDWRTFQPFTLTLPQADGAANEPDARWTHFGPVVSAPDAEQVLAMRWGGFERSRIASASLALPFSTSFEAFRAALKDWDYPPTHFVWAGADGAIGMQQAGRFPLRAGRHNGQVPNPVSGSAADWRGMIAYADMPALANPPDGVIATSNNPVAPEAYFEALGARIGANASYLLDAARGFRAARVEALLEAQNRHDAKSVAAIQNDVTVAGQAEALREVDWQALPGATACHATLAEWNGAYAANSAGALIFAHLWTQVLDRVYRQHLPDDVGVDVGMTQLMSLNTIFADPDSGWWDDPGTVRRERRNERLAPLMQDTCAALSGSYGDDVTAWRWDSVHRAQFTSPVLGRSGFGLLENIANRSDVAVAGGAATVAVSRWKHGKGYAPVHIPGYRMIFDWGAPNEMLVINSVGQSSHPASDNYADQQKRWAKGGYRKVVLDEESVRARMTHTMMLEPMETRR